MVVLLHAGLETEWPSADKASLLLVVRLALVVPCAVKTARKDLLRRACTMVNVKKRALSVSRVVVSKVVICVACSVNFMHLQAEKTV